MSQETELKAIRDAIIAAESSIRTAKHLLASLLGEEMKTRFHASTDGLSAYHEGKLHIVEGVFTGESMLGSDGNTYPVPQNYASKSLLVQ